MSITLRRASDNIHIAQLVFRTEEFNKRERERETLTTLLYLSIKTAPETEAVTETITSANKNVPQI